MTHYNLSHWTITDGKIGLLLFAQSLEEMLAAHSHDSYRVPALNFHYISFEVLKTIHLIEDDVLDKGTIIPLLDEMRLLFEQDSVAHSFLGNSFDAIFYTKNSYGEYEKKSIKIENGKDVNDILPRLKKGTEFIVEELGRNNQYYLGLIQEAKQEIANCGNDLLKLDSLLELTRNIASELINMGFKQSYIYDCIKQTFFDVNHPVNTIEAIDSFFNCFPASSRKYSVYFPINSVKQKKALEDYGTLAIAENVYEMFDASIPYILKYECEARDPYRAREQALTLINFCLSVNQFIKHNRYDYNPKYTEVFDKEGKNVTFIKKSETVMTQGYVNCEELEVVDLLDACLGLSEKAFQVLQMHSAAITSKNTNNQLINLWTAVEVAVPTIRKGSLSRINQISNILTAALSENYFRTLIHQLLLDLTATNDELTEKIKGIELEASIDAKLLYIIVLKKYIDIYDEIVRKLLQTSPLLACRMNRYKSKWSTTKDLKRVYMVHTKRLSQQIMRIYRTRNMLVHDGNSLPYADYVLQNLHYYVDSFVRFLSTYYKEGYSTVQTIVDAAQFKEQKYIESLSIDTMIDEAGIKKYILRK